MTRILLISGRIGPGEETLRRRVLRFTGSRRATRAILRRIEAAQRVDQIMSCMVLPRASVRPGEIAWDVQVSFLTAHGGGHA